jgi:hypothetical protein
MILIQKWKNMLAHNTKFDNSQLETKQTPYTPSNKQEEKNASWQNTKFDN